MKIPGQYLSGLRGAGLFVSEPLPLRSVFPDGVVVGKPISTSGNKIPDYETFYGLDANVPKFDAPLIHLYCHDNVWVVFAEECIPGPGPGDFVNEWTTAEEAVADILDFYFGDAARMEAKASAWHNAQERIRAYNNNEIHTSELHNRK